MIRTLNMNSQSSDVDRKGDEYLVVVLYVASKTAKQIQFFCLSVNMRLVQPLPLRRWVCLSFIYYLFIIYYSFIIYLLFLNMRIVQPLPLPAAGSACHLWVAGDLILAAAQARSTKDLSLFYPPSSPYFSRPFITRVILAANPGPSTSCWDWHIYLLKKVHSAV